MELTSEAQNSYVAYAMSVIVGRALPDIRDGLKPVHRRILFAMHDLGLVHSKPHRKCARVVGEVLGKYHPHGDSAVYDALVRLAQSFSMRATLIAGHGNFGSIDDDPPAAMRYTECRLEALTSQVFLSDLGFDTVDFLPTFDGSLEEPSVLPASLPHLLINGTSGIAVGIATRIPPHNLREVAAGLKALIANPGITLKGLMRHIPAPDFPTGGEIVAVEAIEPVFETGRGPITVRGRAFIEDQSKPAGRKKSKAAPSSGKAVIVITELPYQTYKSNYVADVAAMVDKGTLTGISDVRDESDREGMRIVVEPKRGTSPDVILNALYQHTALQSRFPVNMVAIVDGRPETVNLKVCLEHFLAFRRQVVERRARHHLGNAEKRLHIVEGLLIAQDALDAVVALIRGASDGAQASHGLQQQHNLTVEQADAVLSMTLRRLTSLEAGKLRDENARLLQQIKDLKALLADPKAVSKVIADEVTELARKHGDDRRTKVLRDVNGQLEPEDVIPNHQSLILFSRKGFIKRMPADTFTPQNRGGVGKQGTRLREEDTVEDVLHVNDHDHLLLFTTDGTVRSVRAHMVPTGSRTSSGTSIHQVLALQKTDKIAALLAVSEFTDHEYLLLLSHKGFIKKVALEQFSSVRPNGMKTFNLQDGDELVWVDKCTAACSVMLAASNGQVIHFPTDNATIAPQKRGSRHRGVMTMKLKEGAELVSMSILPAEVMALASSDGEARGAGAGDDAEDAPTESDSSEDEEALGPCALIVSKQGQGHRVPVEHFPLQRRNGLGQKRMRLAKGDSVAALHMVEGGEAGREAEVLLGSASGLMTRTPVNSIGVARRPTRSRGVRVCRFAEDDTVATVTILPGMGDDDGQHSSE